MKTTKTLPCIICMAWFSILLTVFATNAGWSSCMFSSLSSSYTIQKTFLYVINFHLAPRPYCINTLILLCTVQHHTCAYIHIGNIDIVTMTVREATYKYWRFQRDMVMIIFTTSKDLIRNFNKAEWK